MKLVFSENTGEYLNKKSEKSIEPSNLEEIQEISNDTNEVNSIEQEKI